MYLNRRVKNSSSNKHSRAKPNIGVLILVTLVLIFFIRLVGVLKDNKERGAFAYVQLLNFGMPLIETQVYDEGSYTENKLSLRNVCFDVLGFNNISYKGILESELCYLTNTNISNPKKDAVFTFNPFQVSDDSISKVESTPTTTDSKNTQIYNPSLKKEIDESKPEVLIYHSHTTENYSQTQPDSSDENTNVVGAGDVLSKELEDNYGISVIHDKTNHSVSYNDSYTRSGETVDKYLQKYGDFKLIIDLHRDSGIDKSATTTDIYGMSAAKIMFVNAKNSTRYGKNKALTEQIFNKTSELFPTLPIKILTYNRGKNAFNQSKSDACVLFEIGSDSNTPEETHVTAQCMARVIAEIINKK
ncbi:stage II sporulation protein SpoIIP [Clostridium saccharobutylicum]|uniref:stage II sporulation protein P n=1 Tax=Clostridium saccharobutylicum TaxID=169679 RepID=UPI000983B4DC|nr:stage II sporulation protein P [Clostridium saccharobutylicum]AQS08997.1 stage II sporulation protein SpoIIP [Clostridium saccharobutylicum]MBC2435494.1 stage II sporulation protein P [Clostridium saccharobutylicum]NSB87231.1 stage II sporulation protein P [Clostridium saccharobutylicum]NYC28648.1 stage II sporulation protein P [Clostridium saccharobutylicum]OOM18330.1 stage II sporulation protein SpoIIP [Clostridium saccharobutylicum]